MLGARCLRLTALAAAVLLSLGAAAGLVRLLPWLLAPEVPLEVALPFARALGASATETAALIALPIGFALGAARFNERGESRALAALGMSPTRLALSTSAHAAGAALIAFALSLAWGSKADEPGRFAAQLVLEGRASCARASRPKSASVPLVGVTWLCFPSDAPRVTGPLPGTGSRVWFSATDLVPSDDLRELSLTDLRIVTRSAPGERRFDLRVDEGTIRGLPAWGRSAKLAAKSRGALTSATALLLAWLAAFTVLYSGLWQRWLALGAGGAPALSVLLVLQRVDSSGASGAGGTWAYSLAPVAAVVVSASTLMIARRVARGRPRC